MYPDHFAIENAIRPHILALPRYTTSTSDDSRDRPAIQLDANENGEGSCLSRERTLCDRFAGLSLRLDKLHRYPSASQRRLKEQIVKWRQLDSTDQICLGNGASDIIDLIIRGTCIPSKHRVLIAPPTFELYRVSASWHDVGVASCHQQYTTEDGFQLNQDAMCEMLSADPTIRLLILASPGNPTGSLIPVAAIERFLQLADFAGLVVVDEAYIDFAQRPAQATALGLLQRYSNLVIVQSLSKSHGLAGLRVGFAIAHPTLIEQLIKIQMPFKINSPAIALACRAMGPHYQRLARRNLQKVRVARKQLDGHLDAAGLGHPIDGGEANFVLLPVQDEDGKPDDERARWLNQALRDQYSIGVRYVGAQPLCQGCLRITVGSKAEISALVRALTCLSAEK